MPGELGAFDAQATYSDAAADYERASQRYWQFYSPRTVERIGLQPGEQVLDVACGTGPATMAAARAVGPEGRVVAVDYADGMLKIARQKVAAAGLTNVEFAQADMTKLEYGPVFDAVVCVLGIFFVEDMAGAAGKLWSCVKPGGRLAITTLGRGMFSPWIDEFLEAAKREAPEVEVVVPWRRTEDPDVLRDVLGRAGIAGAQVDAEAEAVPCRADDWWACVMGSGLRRAAVDLGPSAEVVRAANAAWAAASGTDTIRCAANYAVARKG